MIVSRSALFAPLVVVALALGSSSASAQEITFAEPTPRPFYVGGGVGFSAALGTSGPVLFKLQEEIGYQMDPISLGSGTNVILRIGGDLAQQLGSAYIFQFGARLTAAFGLWTDGELTLRVAPSAMLGAAVQLFDVCDFVRGCYTASYGAFNLQLATAVELELLDGMLTIWLRPLAVDGFVGDASGARWDVLVGADLHL